MDRTQLSARKKAAVDVVLAKMPSNPTNDALKAEIRAMIARGGDHEQVAMYRLLEVLANFPG